MLSNDLSSEDKQFPAAKKWLVGMLNDNLTDVIFESDSANMQAALYMLDSKNVWNRSYKTNFAEYAIGGPTLEFLCAIHDLANNLTGTDQSTQLKAKAVPEKKGYPRIIASKLSGVCHNKEYYWLASPVVGSPYHSFLVYWNNGSVINQALNCYNGFRPIVCLKSDVIIGETKDGPKWKS